MSLDLDLKSGKKRTPLYIAGWVVLIILGIVLAWYGFSPQRGEPASPAGQTPTATPSLAPLQPVRTLPPAPPTIPPLPTETLPPSVIPSPTPVPPTPTTATPRLVAGPDGSNVRSGPGLLYARIGYLDPGTEAVVTGRYSDWWQIQYQGQPGWVYNGVATAYDTDEVPEVQPPPPPPPAPTPVPVTATPVPVPTATPVPQPTPDLRGLVVNAYWIEGAPGPFGSAADIWFNMDITNNSGQRIDYNALGTWVEETGQFQKSWTYSSFDAGKHFTHRDHINQFDLSPGTYHLYLRICFSDGACVNMYGPIEVVVQ